MNPFKRLIIPGILLSIVIIIAVLGYIFIEGWTFLEALYMVVISLSTVGFREVRALSEAGRIITIFLIICGVGTVAYIVGQLIELMVEGQIIGFRRRRRMEKAIENLENHFIICGYGRVGHQVAHEFIASRIPFVVIDSKPGTAAELEPINIPYIIGDITSDLVLEQAGIKKARGIIACADSDTANVFVTLSARVMNPKIYIIARASQVETEEKMKKAGADRVLSPYFIAGRRLAAMATKPVAVDFLDTVMHSESIELAMEELKIEEGSSLAGKTLSESQIRQKSGTTILAIRRFDGTFDLQPSATSKVSVGDVLVAIGTPNQLEVLSKMV